jgi:hypothetical protein
VDGYRVVPSGWPGSGIGGGYEIDEPTRASRRARRKEILLFAADADTMVSDPGRLTTSLVREDLEWLRRSQTLEVRFRRGSLSTL